MLKKPLLHEVLLEMLRGSDGDLKEEMAALDLLGQDECWAMYAALHMLVAKAEIPEEARPDFREALLSLPEDNADSDFDVVESCAMAIIALDGVSELEAKLAEPGLGKRLKDYLDSVMAQVIEHMGLADED